MNRNRGIVRIDKFEVGDEVEIIGGGDHYTVLEVDQARSSLRLCRSSDGVVQCWRRQQWSGRFRRAVRYEGSGGDISYDMLEVGDGSGYEIRELSGLSGERVLCTIELESDAELVVEALNAHVG